MSENVIALHENEIDEQIFYDIFESLKYECINNFIIGERGNGKGYGAKSYGTDCALASIEGRQVYYYDLDGNKKPVEGVRRAIEEGRVSQFVYLRRREKITDKSAPKFFDNIKHQWPEYQFKYKGGIFYAGEIIIGYALSLSTFGNMNSVDFPFVDFIIYDEFICDPEKNERYLKNEVHQFKEAYETLARPATRGYIVPVFFIANRVTDINDYFVAWNLEVPYNKAMARVFHGGMLVQLTKTDKFKEMKLQTPYYKMLAAAGDEQYINYAVMNKALRDTEDYIRKAPSDGEYQFTLEFNDSKFGVFYSYKENMFFVSNRVDEKFGVRFTTEPTLHTERTMLVKRKGTSAIFNRFLIYFQNSLVWYRNKEVKYVTLRNLNQFR